MSSEPALAPAQLAAQNMANSSFSAQDQIQSPPPPEIESTLARLSAYRNVRGVMILSRYPSTSPSSASGSINGAGSSRHTIEATRTDSGANASTNGIDSSSSPLSSSNAGGIGGIVQSTGSVFEGESGKKYARAVENIVACVAKSVSDVDQGDELKLMRIRTKRHELIITPDEKYLLVVLQDPGQ